MAKQERDKERSQSRAEKKHAGERRVDKTATSGESRERMRERKRGGDFRERGLRGPPRRGAESRPRAFSSLFLALLAALFFLFFFCARPPSRGARAAFHPRGPRRFFFSSVCAATPPHHNGRVPENSSLGRHPFPRPPRLFH